MMLWKCCTQYASKSGKLSSGHRAGKVQFSAQSQRKTTPKNLLLNHVQFTILHGLKFQVPMQYYSLQQCTLLSPDTSKTEHHISFGPASSFWSHFFALSIIMYAYQLGGSSSDVISLCPLILLFGILRQKYWSALFIPFSSGPCFA